MNNTDVNAKAFVELVNSGRMIESFFHCLLTQQMLSHLRGTHFIGDIAVIL